MNFQYKELTDKAYNYHSNNMFDKAEEIYLYLLAINPDDVNVLNLIGLLYIAVNEANKAINYLSKAFILKKSAYIASNLAKAYYMNSEPEKAIKMYKVSLQYKEDDDTCYSIAIAYKKLNDFENVIYYYKKALDINPDNYNASYNLTLVYKAMNNIDEAINLAFNCIRINPKDSEMYALLSELYENKADYKSSIKYMENAVNIEEDYVYYYNLGVLYSKIDNIQSSVKNYKKSILIKDDFVESYVNLAGLYKNNDNEKALEYLKKAYEISPYEENVLLSLAQTYKDMYRNRESIEILDTLLKINIKCAEAYSLYAMNYMDTGEYERALEMYTKALLISPKNINYMHGKAIALKYLGRKDEAKKILEYVVKQKNVDVQSSITLGIMYLSERNYKIGMPLYSLRIKESKLKGGYRDKLVKSNDDISNKNIIVYTDCGLGDTIMYSRYIPYLKEKVKSVILQTDKELVSVLQENYEDIQVCSKSTLICDFDYVLPIMDIQSVLGMDFTNIPDKNGYLKANNSKIINAKSIECLNTKKKKIGLFWQGNKKIFKNRSVDFEYIKDLTKNEHFNFYSFQIESDVKETDNFFSLKPYIKDYSDTAALIKNMDLMITIDSSIVHMSGAIAANTLLLLPKTPEWRWFDDEEKSSWYNSVKIIKQTNSGDWNDVFDRVKKELDKYEN